MKGEREVSGEQRRGGEGRRPDLAGSRRRRAFPALQAGSGDCLLRQASRELHPSVAWLESRGVSSEKLTSREVDADLSSSGL